MVKMNIRTKKEKWIVVVFFPFAHLLQFSENVLVSELQSTDVYTVLTKRVLATGNFIRHERKKEGVYRHLVELHI